MGLTLLRHTTPQVAPGTCYGRRDLPLASSFAAEAEAVLTDLPDTARIVSSPALRCHRLAAWIGAARGLTPQVDPRLAEMDFGTWEGQPWDAVPRAGLDAWARDFMQARPHGGESVAMLVARVRPALADLRGAATVLAVTHAGVIRAALALAGRADPWQAKVGFGQTVTLEWDEIAAL
ncbi:MAG: histidine phosphatase family protein [Rhodobacteraceae bacterium]|nr:histidine phosphatase family protein [Paracoccaceae bacterium]